MAYSLADDSGLFGNLFGHKVLMAGFIDTCSPDFDCAFFPIGDFAGLVANFKRRAC